MIFGNKDKSGNMAINVSTFEGIPTMPRGIAVRASIADDKLSITSRAIKVDPVTLELRKITGVTITTDREIEEQHKSSLGRAAVGGVLLGPLGAIIGGISGTGSKSKTVLHNYIVVNYMKDSGEMSVVAFECAPATMGVGKFVTALKEAARQANPQPTITEL